MPVPAEYVGKPFRLSVNVQALRVRKDRGGKSRELTGPVVTFEADDAVDVASLMRGKVIVPDVASRRRAAAAEEPQTTEHQPAGG